MSILIKQRNRLFRLKVPRALKIAYVWGKGLGVLANKNFKKGEVVIKFRADLVPNSKASPEAVQVDEHHSFDTRWLVTEAFINHSCEPNAKLDVERKSYIAIKPIGRNQEITFDYNTTEWDSGGAFKCNCGSKNCYGEVRGLKYLSHEQQRELKPHLPPFLLAKLK